MVTGDFNLPAIDWNMVTTTKGQNHLCQKLIDTMRDLFLHQHIDQPTRHHHGQNANILDLVITNEEEMVENMQYIP